MELINSHSYLFTNKTKYNTDNIIRFKILDVTNTSYHILDNYNRKSWILKTTFEDIFKLIEDLGIKNSNTISLKVDREETIKKVDVDSGYEKIRKLLEDEKLYRQLEILSEISQFFKQLNIK